MSENFYSIPFKIPFGPNVFIFFFSDVQNSHAPMTSSAVRFFKLFFKVTLDTHTDVQTTKEERERKIPLAEGKMEKENPAEKLIKEEMSKSMNNLLGLYLWVWACERARVGSV